MKEDILKKSMRYYPKETEEYWKSTSIWPFSQRSFSQSVLQSARYQLLSFHLLA